MTGWNVTKSTGQCRACLYASTERYRQTQKGKAAVARYMRSAKGKASRRKWLQSANGSRYWARHSVALPTVAPGGLIDLACLVYKLRKELRK